MFTLMQCEEIEPNPYCHYPRCKKFVADYMQRQKEEYDKNKAFYDNLTETAEYCRNKTSNRLLPYYIKSEKLND